jgi:hypothetical protein
MRQREDDSGSSEQQRGGRTAVQRLLGNVHAGAGLDPRLQLQQEGASAASSNDGGTSDGRGSGGGSSAVPHVHVSVVSSSWRVLCTGLSSVACWCALLHTHHPLLASLACLPALQKKPACRCSTTTTITTISSSKAASRAPAAALMAR